MTCSYDRKAAGPGEVDCTVCTAAKRRPAPRRRLWRTSAIQTGLNVLGIVLLGVYSYAHVQGMVLRVEHSVQPVYYVPEQVASAQDSPESKSKTDERPATSPTVVSSNRASSQPKNAVVNNTVSEQIAAATSVGELESVLRTFSGRYGITIQVNDTAAMQRRTGYSWSRIDGGSLVEAKRFAALFVEEWEKYPPAVVRQSGLSHVVLVTDARTVGAAVGGFAVMDMGRLYFNVGGMFGDGTWMRKTIHHEFSHILEYRRLGHGLGQEAAWSKLNPSGFRYGQVGRYSANLFPRAGFVTDYATSSQAEDKAETYAFLMTTGYYHQLIAKTRTDAVLAAKVDRTKQVLRQHYPGLSDAYIASMHR